MRSEQFTDDPVRVLIFAEHELPRRGLQGLLSSMVGVVVVDAPGDPSSGLHLVRERAADVAVVCTTDMEFRQALSAASREACVPLLVLLPSNEEREIRRALVEQAAGYLLEQDVNGPVLGAAVEALRLGQSLICQEIMELLRESRSMPDLPAEWPKNPQTRLTPREREVLKLLIEGLSNKQIARRLNITQHGAKRHVGSILSKLNCPNRTQVVALALQSRAPADSGDPPLQMTR